MGQGQEQKSRQTILGKRLREARQAKGLSLENAAQLLKIDFSLLGQYERGPKQPRPNRLPYLADFYGVTVDWLLGREERRISPGAVAHRYPAPSGLTAESPQDDWAAFLTDAISLSGIDLTKQDRRQIAEAAAAVVSTLAKQKAAQTSQKEKPPTT